MADPELEWYYNNATGEVAQGLVFDSNHRMGPYATEEEARHALEIAAERNLVADAQDAEDHGWEE